MQRTLACALCSLSLIVATSSTLASAAPDWQISLNFGRAFNVSSNSNSVVNNGNLQFDTYETNSLMPSNLMDISFLRNYRWADHLFQVGLEWNRGFNEQVQGTLIEFSLPGYDNYTYTYTVRRQTFFAVAYWGMLPLDEPRRWQPYLQAGIGRSYNQTSHYSQTANPGVLPMVSPAYAGQSNAATAYEVGIGESYVFNRHLRVQAQYVYMIAGQAKLGPGIYGPSAPVQSLVYNTLLAGISCQF